MYRTKQTTIERHRVGGCRHGIESRSQSAEYDDILYIMHSVGLFTGDAPCEVDDVIVPMAMKA